MRSSMMIGMVAALPLNLAGTAMAAYGGLPPKYHGEWCPTYKEEGFRMTLWFETCKGMTDEFRKSKFAALPAGSQRLPSRIVLDENGMSVKIHSDRLGEEFLELICLVMRHTPWTLRRALLSREATNRPSHLIDQILTLRSEAGRRPVIDAAGLDMSLNGLRWAPV